MVHGCQVNAVTDGYLPDYRVDLASPKVQKPLHPRITRLKIKGLPDKFVDQATVVGQVIEDVYRHEDVALSYHFFKFSIVEHGNNIIECMLFIRRLQSAKFFVLQLAIGKKFLYHGIRIFKGRQRRDGNDDL